MAYNLGTAQGQIRIEYDSRGVARARDDMGRFISMSELMGDDMDSSGDKVDKASKKFQLFGAQVAKVTAIILAAGAASQFTSAALGGIVLVGQSLIPIITASLATLPGLLLAAAGAAVVLKLGMAGVGDAIKAAFAQDASKFAEAIKKLAPEAQAAAKSFYAMGTAAKPLQQALQNALFKATAPLISSLIPAITGLTPVLTAVATGFNSIFKSMLTAFGSTAFIDAVSKAMEGLSQFLLAMAPGFIPLIEGFSKLAGQAGKFFESFGDSAGQALETFGNFLGGLDLDAMWQTAGAALQNLGELFSALGSIIGSIVRAFTGAGQAMDDLGGPTATLANSLNNVITKLADFLDSAAGTAILEAFATALSSIASAGGDAVLSLLTALGPIFAELSPLVSSLATALGPVLGAAFAALSPLLTGIANGLRLGLGPVLPSLVEAFTSLAPVIGQIAGIFGGVFSTALQTVLPVIARLAVILAGTLQQALVMMLPYIEQWGKAFQEVAVTVLPQLLPLIAQLAPLLLKMLPLVLAAATAFMVLLIPAMKLMIPVITVVITYVNYLMAIWDLLISALTRVGSAFQSAWGIALGITVGAWNAIRSAVTGGTSAISSAVTGAINGVKSTFASLSALPGQVGGYFRQMVSGVQSAIGSMLGVVRAIPGQIRGALGNLGGALFSAGADVIQGFINGIRSMAGAAAAAARAAVAGVPGAIKGALGISSPSKVTMALGREVSNGLAIGILQTAAKVERAIMDVATMIPAQIASGFEANATATGQAYISNVIGSSPAVVQGTPLPAPGAGLTVNQTVNALPGQSAKAVGDSAVQRLVFGVMTGTSGLAPAEGTP